MKESPILFQGDMVRAILEGRKTQTRRIIKPQPFSFYVLDGCDKRGFANFKFFDGCNTLWWPQSNCQFGGVGDRIWVRETWAVSNDFDNIPPSKLMKPTETEMLAVDYAANEHRIWGKENQGKWRPSIHMPRWASRINLEIDEIRVERLQDISDNDCEAEGVRPSIDGNGQDWRENETGWRRTFRQLWDSINFESGYGWDKNPWVWVIKFHRVEA